MPPPQLALALGALPQGLRPRPIFPTSEPFDDPAWLFDGLWGGLRALVSVEGGEARIAASNGRDLTGAFPEVAEAVARAVRVDGVVLDGELVTRDRYGAPSLRLVADRLMPRTGPGEPTPVAFEAWDILYQAYRPCLRTPLIERKRLLQESLAPSNAVHLSGWQPEIGTAFYEAALSLGLEGVLARPLRSPYTLRRSGQPWLAIRRERSAPLVVGGYTVVSAAGRSRQPVERLFLGAYDGDRLRFAGDAAGLSGADAALLHRQLARLHRPETPFADPPQVPQLLYWCEPRVVVHVAYGELAPDGGVRFARLVTPRPDLAPRDCTIEGLTGLRAVVSR